MKFTKNLKIHSKCKDVQGRDVYKMKIAIENGYQIIKIYQKDIMKNKSLKVLNFTAKWETALCIAIYILKNTSDTKILYLSSEENLYSNHTI